MPSDDYLQEGFNPRSLKIAELRRILTENTVAYPSSAKKKDLLKLYDEFIVPMIPELREKYGISKSNNDNKGDIEIIGPQTQTQKKRKLEDSFVSTFHSRSPSISSVSSIEEDIIKELRKNVDIPTTPKRKKPKYDAEGKKTTPILEKVASKKVSEHFDKNVTSISDFDISNSSISEEEPESEDSFNSETKKGELHNKRLDQNIKKKKPTFDFSYKRKGFKQDSSNLKMSLKFTEQLQGEIIEKEREIESNVTGLESTDNLHATKAHLEVVNNQSQVSIVNEGIKDEKEATNNSIVSQPQFNSFQTRTNNINKIEEIVDTRTGTPDLPISQDVIASEQSIEMAENGKNDGNEENSQYEDVNWLTNRSNKVDLTDVIDLEASEKETKSDVIDLEEAGDEIEDGNQIEDDMIENIVKDDTKLIINDLDISTNNTKVPLIFKRFLYVSFKSFLLLFLGLLIFFIVWFYQNNIYTGYCGQEQHFPTFGERYPDFIYSERIDSILKDYKPSCIPCPENGVCFPYMKLKCKPEYKVERSPIDIFGLFPFKNRCVKDDKKKELINEIVSKSLEFLRLRNAQMACGESKDDMESGITEVDLFNIFQESKTSSFEDEEFKDIWEQVVELLKTQPDIIYRQVSKIEFF